jgi:fimbrial chaperone protein
MYTGSAFIRAMAALALAIGFAAGAQAISLTVTPLVLKLDDTDRSGALSVTNESGEARVIQVELVRWTQKNGQNVQTPSADLLVNPPLATVQPGQSQTIRIGLRQAADSTQERAYRVYITGVPPPGEHINGLRVVLRLGVPIYVAPKADASADVHWDAARAPNGELVLTLLNDGNRHVRIDSFKAVDAATGHVIGASRPDPFTLLAGQARRYGMRLPSGWHGGELKLIAKTEDGSSEASVEVP